MIGDDYLSFRIRERFDWRRAAQETLAVYEEVCGRVPTPPHRPEPWNLGTLEPPPTRELV